MKKQMSGNVSTQSHKMWRPKIKPGYMIQLTLASIIGAAGFYINSETVVIGSMLVSPIGALIIRLFIQWFNTQGLLIPGTPPMKAIWKTLSTLVIPVGIGALGGLAASKMDLKQMNDKSQSVVRSRGANLVKKPWGYWTETLMVGALIAMCGGMAILTVESPSDSPLIGVGIATALLPPLVAAGYALGLGAGREEKDWDSAKHGSPKNQFAASLSIFLVNVFFVIAGLVVLGRICPQCATGSAGVDESKALTAWWETNQRVLEDPEVHEPEMLRESINSVINLAQGPLVLRTKDAAA